MVTFVKSSDKNEFIIGTEQELIHRLKKEAPEKTYYSVPGAVCPTMKMITLTSIINALENLSTEVVLDTEIMAKARKPLERMMEIGRGDQHISIVSIRRWSVRPPRSIDSAISGSGCRHFDGDLIGHIFNLGPPGPRPYH